MRPVALAVLVSLAVTVAVALIPGLRSLDAAQPLPPVVEGRWASHVAPVSVCPGGDDATAPPAAQHATMLCLVNYARAVERLAPLPQVAALAESAAMKARQIASCRHFAHDPCGVGETVVFETAGYGLGASRWSTGENLYLATVVISSPRLVINGWLGSKDHRENLFRPQWREQGVALLTGVSADGNEDVHVWVSHFGVRD